MCVQAQDSTKNENKKDETVPVEAPPEKKDVFSPPSFSGQGTSSPTEVPANAVDVGSYDDYVNRQKKYAYNPYDTLKPYIASSVYMPIIPWNKGLTTSSTVLDTNFYRLSAQKQSDLGAVAVLDAWRQETRVFSVPFQLEGVEEIYLSRYFDLPADIQQQTKQLYLYFEGIAWHAELRLNGKFLAINDKPFAPWVVQLRTDWLRAEDNLLELSLSVGEGGTGYPQPFLGIYRPVYIFQEQQLAKAKAAVMPEVEEAAGRVAIVAPYYHLHHYVFNKFEAIRTLIHAYRAGVKHLYFMYEPDREMKLLCKEMGFTMVKRLREGQQVCWLNAYPYHPRHFPFTERFWLDLDGYRSPHYGSFYAYSLKDVHVSRKPLPLLYILGLLIPLLALFVVKLLNPKFFYSFPEILLRPRLQLDRFMEAIAGNQGMGLILQILRVLILAITFSLFIDYIHTNNQWHILRPFNPNGILQLVFGERGSFSGYFLKILIIISLWTMLKGLVYRSLSGLFKIHQLYAGMENIELLGSYPLIFLLPLPLLFLTFAPPHLHGFLLYIQALLLILYLLRQMYVAYTGMEKLFKFSFSVKVLYMLLAILLPYLVCF